MNKITKVEAITLVKAWELNNSLQNKDNKEYFNEFFDVLKYEDTRDESLKILQEVGKGIALDSRRKLFNSTLKACMSYTIMNKVVVHSKIDYANIREVTKLHNFITKNYDAEVLDECKTRIDKVYSSKLSTVAYNNLLFKEIGNIKDKYKLEATYSYISVSKKVHDMSRADRDKLLAELLSEQEVAA